MKNFLKGIVIVALVTAFSLTTAQAEVQTENEEVPVKEITKSLTKMKHTFFPIGKPNAGYAQYFTGKSYLYPMESGAGMSVFNVTFEPSCINHWHIHHGSCQILSRRMES